MWVYIKCIPKNKNIKNQVLYHYENLIKRKKLETTHIVIDKNSCKDLMIYFNRYHTDKSIGNIEKYGGKRLYAT